MEVIGQKPTKYEYWYVGYICGSEVGTFGRVEVSPAEIIQEYAEYEIPLNIRDTTVDSVKLMYFIDNLTTDYPVKTQEEILELYNKSLEE